MMLFGKLKLALVPLFMLSVSLSAAPSFNNTGVQGCVTSVVNCTVNILNFNRNETDFTSCTTPFSTCLGEFGFNDPLPTPEACYLAGAAWENCYISIGAFLGVLFVNNFLLPALLKGTAYAITSMMNMDQNEHPYLSRIGNVLGIFTDGDRNGNVNASEIYNPQSLITVACISLPFFYWYIANDAQAKCDYAWALYKQVFPQVDDDDMFRY